MFEQALIRRAGVDRHVDLGWLAETLFFYGSTHLVLDRGSVAALVSKIASRDLLDLINRADINARLHDLCL